jgi:hypothetical protein
MARVQRARFVLRMLVLALLSASTVDAQEESFVASRGSGQGHFQGDRDPLGELV